MVKDDLVETLKVVLASAFSLYLKSHNFHWNVTGPNFIEYHKFLGKFYEEVYESVDGYAEHIRALGKFAPGSLKRFSELTKINDELSVPSAKFMLIKLASDNEDFLNLLRDARKQAIELDEGGVMNYLEGRIDWHEKMQWQLNAFAE